MGELGRLTAVFDADTRKFDSGIRGVATKVVALEGSLRGLTGGATSAIGTLSGLAGPLSIAAGAAVAAASAISGVAVGLWELTKRSAKAGGELFDLSQKTGFAVETLSGLSIVAKTTGSDINGLSPSLVIFQKNMQAAGDATSRQGRLFRALSIDTRDNEKALRQAFAALGKMGEGSQQTALAMQLFGRSGKDVLAIIKETNGNLDQAIQKYDKMGLIIGTGAAAASDKFNDVLEETTLQLDAVTRKIGLELLPVATETLQSISADLTSNKDKWSDWGKTIADTVRGVRAVMQSEGGQIIAKIFEIGMSIQPLMIALRALGKIGAANAPSEDFFGPGGAARGGRVSLPGTPEWLAAQRRLKGVQDPRIALGGGGKGGGEDPAKTAERIASLQLEAVISGLRAEQEANKRALDLRRQDFNDYATQYMVIENRRHDAVVAGLDKEQKAAEKLKKGREVALLEIKNKRAEEDLTHEENRNKNLDDRARILDKIDKFLRDQDRDIARLTNTTDQWDQAYQGLVDTLKEEGVTLEENTRIRIESNNALAREKELVLSVTRARQVLQSVRERVVTKAGRDRPPWIDLGGGSTVGGEPATTERPRIATVDEQVMRDRLAMMRERMRELAGDLTGIFSQSVGDGFNNGIKSGLQTLSQGLLQIVQDVFLRRMAEGLADMLSGIGSGGGGGFFGSLLRGVLGGVSGGLGGSIGGLGSASAGGVGTVFAGAIGRASGGPIWPNQLYKVHKDEYIMPTAPGMVIPKGGMGQTVINKHYTIQLPPDSRGSYNSPKSRRQLSETLIAALATAKA